MLERDDLSCLFRSQWATWTATKKAWIEIRGPSYINNSLRSLMYDTTLHFDAICGMTRLRVFASWHFVDFLVVTRLIDCVFLRLGFNWSLMGLAQHRWASTGIGQLRLLLIDKWLLNHLHSSSYLSFRLVSLLVCCGIEIAHGVIASLQHFLLIGTES